LKIPMVLKINLERAGFVTPTPIQAGALEPALNGSDILGTAQTGTGKTLAFLLPILSRLMESRSRNVEALILAPTRELGLQTIETLKVIGSGCGVYGVLVAGGFSEGRQLDAIRRGARLVVATPGRLDDYIKRSLINLSSVKILVLDEADRMVDMGFLPQMKNIMNGIPKERQTMCFSATLSKEVSHLVHDYLRKPVRVEVGSTLKPAESVTLHAYEVSRSKKTDLLSHLIRNDKGTFLVFTRTKHGADKLMDALRAQGFSVAVIHGGRSQFQRLSALRGFKEGRHRVLVATDVAARGIHVQGISHVINYDLPQAPEDFIHRVGRTGRVNEQGMATTFVAEGESQEMRRIEHILGKSITRGVLPEGFTPLKEERQYRKPFTPSRSRFQKRPTPFGQSRGRHGFAGRDRAPKHFFAHNI